MRYKAFQVMSGRLAEDISGTNTSEDAETSETAPIYKEGSVIMMKAVVMWMSGYGYGECHVQSQVTVILIC
jgi:hypothetical protein